MRFQFTFRHMDVSPALRSYAEQKLRAKITKFDSHAALVNVSFEPDRHHHLIQCWVSGSDGARYIAENRSQHDFYASVDEVAEKIEMQMRRHKEKSQQRKVKNWEDYVRMLEHGAALDFRPPCIDAEDILRQEYSRQSGGVSASWA